MRIESPEREWMFAKGVAKIGNASCIVVIEETQEVIAGKARLKAIRGDLRDVKIIHKYDIPTDAGTVSLGIYCDGRREAWLVRFIKNDDSLIKAIQFASNWKNPDDYDWEKIVGAVRLLHGKGWKLEELGMSDLHTKHFIDAVDFSASKIQDTENQDIQ